MRKPRRMGRKPFSWLAMGTDIAMLGVKAQMAIGQRIALLMVGGPKARTEAQRMVTEKVLAAGKAAVALATGRKPRKVVRGYRKKVQANRMRLSKGDHIPRLVEEALSERSTHRRSALSRPNAG